MTTALVSKLPLPDSFELTYLESNGILPLEVTDQRLRVAVAGEPAVEVLDDLEVSFGLPIEVVPVSREELLDGVRRAFAAAESVVNLLIRDAHNARASDIHLESTRDGLRTRFRIDGVLQDAPSPPKELQAAVVSRAKLI